MWPYLSSLLIPVVIAQVKNISQPENVTEQCLLLFIPSFVIASCWRGMQRCAALLAWDASTDACVCVRAEPGWCVVQRGRFAMQSRSTRAGCTMAAHQEAVVVSRHWGNSSVPWEWIEMCLAPWLMEGSKVQPWPGSPLKPETEQWGSHLWLLWASLILNPFREAGGQYSLSVWSLYLFPRMQ